MILPEVLFSLFLEEFSIFLNYSCALHFDEKPNYGYIHRLFHNVFVHEGYQYGHPFAECTIPNNQSAMMRAENNSRERVLQSGMGTTSNRVFIPSSISLEFKLTFVLGFALILIYTSFLQYQSIFKPLC